MFKINVNDLINQGNSNNSKTILIKDNSVAFDNVKLSLVNLTEVIINHYLYNASNWAMYIDRWILNLNPNNLNKTHYKRGDIVFLDLGAQNFAHEPSYKHACIVLSDTFDSILIVPCSTKQYGKNRYGIIDATKSDGFIKNTGVQSLSFRWVNKNRVVSKTNKKVSNRILNEIDKVFLSLTPSIKNLIKQKDNEINQLKIKIERLENNK